MKKKDIEYELKQLKITYINKGFKRLILRLFDYFLKRFMFIGYTYKLDLDKMVYIPPGGGLTFQGMTIPDLDLISQNYKDEINEKLYQDLFEKLNNPKFNGFIVKKDGKICNYCFIHYGTTYPILKNKYVDLECNGYLLNDYVFKKYRGQKIQEYDIYNRLKILKKKNYKTATGLIERYNYPSCASYEKFGFKKCVICYFFRFGKLMRSRDHFKIISRNDSKEELNL